MSFQNQEPSEHAIILWSQKLTFCHSAPLSSLRLLNAAIPQTQTISQVALLV